MPPSVAVALQIARSTRVFILRSLDAFIIITRLRDVLMRRLRDDSVVIISTWRYLPLHVDIMYSIRMTVFCDKTTIIPPICAQATQTVACSEVACDCLC